MDKDFVVAKKGTYTTVHNPSPKAHVTVTSHIPRDIMASQLAPFVERIAKITERRNKDGSEKEESAA